MNRRNHLLGDATLKQLKEEVSPVEFERYIKQLTYNEEASRSDLAVFEAPNPLIANWIKTKYSDMIAHIIESKNGGIKPKVEIAISSSNGNTPPAKTAQKVQQQKPQKSTILNPSFTFESFVVGSSNQFAYSTAEGVAKKPGQAYNPLLLYGGTGLGKTHLLNAIGNHAIKQNLSVIYVTSEQFLNDFLYHLRNQTMDRFKEKYRSCDFLLIDDVQFFGGKPQIQEEFFHTFNELHTKNKQIVLTADKPPKQIAGLEERLKSRFEWGLTADIQPPELETKIAIIKKKCEFDGIYLTNDIVHYIATHMDNNIREIEGTIIRLNAFATVMDQEITLEFAKSLLKEQIKEQRENITLDLIIKVVSRELNVKPSEIKSKSRTKQISDARRIVIYLARTLTHNSMPSLAQYFGMKDHSSVSHAMKKINSMIDEDANFKLIVEELKHKIVSKDT